jgi:hypothetical protein
MRRNPRKVREPPYTLAPVPIAQGWGRRPSSVGDVVRPWVGSGGLPYFLDAQFVAAGSPAATPQGWQLCAAAYIGQGNTGFVKSIQIAPYKPSIFHSSGTLEYLGVGTIGGHGIKPDGDAGYWHTPMAWEGYFTIDPETGAFTPPFWQWHIRFLQGTIAQAREANNIPAFSFADPNSWFLIPNIPVPGAPSADAYPSGLPGSVPGDPWGAQRFQRIGAWEEGELHMVVPGNTTVLLFAEWRQAPIVPLWLTIPNPPPAPPLAVPTPIVALAIPNADQNFVYPLGPSFGKLIGYTQPDRSLVTLDNARRGWRS